MIVRATETLKMDKTAFDYGDMESPESSGGLGADVGLGAGAGIGAGSDTGRETGGRPAGRSLVGVSSSGSVSLVDATEMG